MFPSTVPIGDRTESWFWLDGTSLDFQNWQDEEPNNVGGDENRGVMNMSPGTGFLQGTVGARVFRSGIEADIFLCGIDFQAVEVRAQW